MRRSELTRHVPMAPAQVLDSMVSPQAWTDDGATVTVDSGRTEGLRMTTSSPLPLNRIPLIARTVLGPGAVIVQEFRAAPVTDAADAATVHVRASVPGVSLDVRVEIHLRRRDGESTDVRARIETACSIPMIGSMIEAHAHQEVEAMLSAELDRLTDV